VALCTVITSVVAKLIPIVKAVVELAAIEVPYTSAFPIAAAAPALRTYTVAEAAEAVTLVIVRVETTVLVAAGTVYRSALDVLAGALCPRTLYVTAILGSHH
jgi:hypothetical protein